MANWNSVRLNPIPPAIYPPGDIDYPEQVNNLIDLNEDVATEIENARDQEVSLLLNVQSYIKSTIIQDIDGQGLYKMSSMIDGTAASTNYATVSQVQAMNPGWPEIDDVGFNDGFTVAHSEFRVLNSTDFSVFDYKSSYLYSGGTHKYPNIFNTVFFLDWDTTAYTLVDLDSILAPVPIFGDRIILIFINTGINDGIQAATSRINGLTEKITFGESDVINIYELVFTSTSSTGWLFKNVIIAAGTDFTDPGEFGPGYGPGFS